MKCAFKKSVSRVLYGVEEGLVIRAHPMRIAARATDHSRAQLRGNGEGEADPQRDWRQVAVLYLTQPRLFGLRVGTRFGSRVIGDVPGPAVGPFWATSDKPEDCGRGRPGAADSP